MNTLNLENYYRLMSEESFNNANFASFFKQFAGRYQTTGVAVRLQESAVLRTLRTYDYHADRKQALQNAIAYATTLLRGNALTKPEIIEQMTKFRKGVHTRIDDLPDWVGDTVYAFIPTNQPLVVPDSRADEIEKVNTVTIDDTTFDVYRLWWD